MLGTTVQNLVVHVTWHMGFVHLLYSGGRSIAPLILNLSTNCGEWLTSCPDHLITRERVSGTHWAGGWVGPRADLDILEKRKIPCPWPESSPNCWAHGVATILTTLSWLPWWDWIVQSVGFWIVVLCIVQMDASRSEELATPVFRVELTLKLDKITQCYGPRHHSVNSNCCENLKLHIEHYYEP